MIQGIGWAVKQMQDGYRVRRAGWNGKGMFLFLVAGKEKEVKHGGDGHLGAAFAIGETVRFRPYVAMKTATDDVVPWLCSQTDLLAIDWEYSNQ